jgi:Insertion element 4 transposase N-terminal/Transposase DDE domain
MRRGPFTDAPSADEGAFKRLQESINPEWIEQALEATGTATLRTRRLPAEQVLWLVLGMALYRGRPIDELVGRLDLVLPGTGRVGMARSGVAQARARLGDEPMKWLFERCAHKWAHESARKRAWRGLAVYGVDGTTVRVPDSPTNRAHFGSQDAGAGRGSSGYPLARVVTLMALRSHLLAGASFGPYTSELSYATSLWPQLPAHSLAIVDRGFLSAKILIPLARDGENRHWLTRAKRDSQWTVVQRLGRGDTIVEREVSRPARAQDPTLPSKWTMRAIEYRRPGFRPQTLLTSMLDPVVYPAAEVVALYHQRWEIELGYDEVKTDMLERQEAIRSRTPKGVSQELWGVALAYNLVRLEMERVADEADVEPSRISFVMALRLIRDEWMWSAATRSPGAIPKHLRELREEVARFVLPPRRARTYPRAVKIKMSNYPRKRPAKTPRHGPK